MSDDDETTRLVRWRRVEHGGEVYDRTTVRTPWLAPGDDLAAVLAGALHQFVRAGDIAFISEKVVILASGRTVPIAGIHPGRMARRLVRHVHPRTGSRGLAVPEKMQYVIDETGVSRVLLAAAMSAVTRPFGWGGVFYRIAGPLARDLDGGRPPYEQLLFPPLPPDVAQRIADDLETALGVAVTIIDLNDYGGTIRATSRSAPDPAKLRVLLRDNPLGQRSTGTPLGLLRRRSA